MDHLDVKEPFSGGVICAYIGRSSLTVASLQPQPRRNTIRISTAHQSAPSARLTAWDGPGRFSPLSVVPRSQRPCQRARQRSGVACVDASHVVQAGRCWSFCQRPSR